MAFIEIYTKLLDSPRQIIGDDDFIKNSQDHIKKILSGCTIRGGPQSFIFLSNGSVIATDDISYIRYVFGEEKL